MFLKFYKFHWKTSVLEFLLNTQVFSSEICKILKSNFFEEYLQTTPSGKALTANYYFITTHFFPFRKLFPILKLKWLKVVEQKCSWSVVLSSELSLSSVKYKWCIVFSVFLLLDQNLMKPKKQS